ncbi:hypothetical protein [Chitinilyticum litopenaei]|uniref:hypothetical protein n=1 Tax=Chitinilyticum litopenaei TaxID=1121276 RepID=UPI00118570EC|nr:hypothetical protein [Chitinilyticum litopenaei]
MKKAKIATLTVSAAMSVGALLPAQQASAASTCTSATNKSTALSCSIDTAGYSAVAFTFTGSNGVRMGISDTTGYFAACGNSVDAKTNFGLTTNGGSMTTGAYTSGSAPTATSGGC